MQNEGMVHAMWLTSTSANFYIMREAGLVEQVNTAQRPLSVRMISTYPHSRVQSSRYLIILLYSRTASEDFGQPELSHSAFHVADFALRQLRRSNPL